MNFNYRDVILAVLIIAIAIDMYFHYPTPRKILEFENKLLTDERDRVNQINADLISTIEAKDEKYAAYVLKTDAQIERLNKIVQILAQLQGVRDIDKLLEDGYTIN